jgi:hypothetical protein
MGTVETRLEPIQYVFTLLWRGNVDDVPGMIRLSRASRRLERRACFGVVVVLLLLDVRSGHRRLRGRVCTI